MSISTSHLQRCIETLQLSLHYLREHEPETPQYEVFRNAVIKGFELVLETTGNILRRALKTYGGNPNAIDELSYKDVLRHGGKRGLLTAEAIERWFAYRDNRNIVAHDYGQKFADETLKLLPNFINDAWQLSTVLHRKFGGDRDA